MLKFQYFWRSRISRTREEIVVCEQGNQTLIFSSLSNLSILWDMKKVVPMFYLKALKAY